MPGVVISTAVRTGPSSATVRESSQLFVVGMAERGPSDMAILVNSIADFESVYGKYQSYSYLHPTVETFFEEGGTQCYVARTVGASATTGSLELLDSDEDTVITISANGPGAWSANVDVEVLNPSPTTFKINFYYESKLVYSTGTCTSSAQAVGRINLSTVASHYVEAELETGASTIPDAVMDSLSTGNDNHGSVNSASYVSAVELFNGAYGTGAVACPEDSGTTVTNGLIAHANENNRVAILFGASDASYAQIKAKALDIQAEENAEHAALYFPWVNVPTPVAGVSMTIPPVGYVAAKRAVAHNQSGSHVPAAGLLSASRYVTGLVTDINKTNGDDLDNSFVNAIRLVQNSVRVYGARSCSADEENFRYITTMDTVNFIVVEAAKSLEDLVFSTIDGRNTIFSAIESRLIAILSPLRDIGALYEAYDANGKKIDSGFTVKCDAGLNPTAQLAGGTVKAKVGVRTSSVGDKIEVDIIKSNLTASVV